MKKVLLGVLIILALPVIYLIGSFLYNLIITGSIVENGEKISDCYLKRGDDVYYYRFAEFYDLKKLSSVQNDFQLLDGYDCLAKDSNVVFYEKEVIDGADPKSTTVVYYERFDTYIKDNQHVYYRSKIISGADPATFTMYKNGEETYSKDKNAAYYLGSKIEGFNPNGFSVVVDIAGYTNQFFIKDLTTNKVYYLGKLTGFDGVSFQILSTQGTISKDKNGVYYKTDKIEDINPSTVVKVEPKGSIYKDTDTVFYVDSNKAHVIEGVQASKFRKYNKYEFKLDNKETFSDVCGDEVRHFYCNTGSEVDSKRIKFY